MDVSTVNSFLVFKRIINKTIFEVWLKHMYSQDHKYLDIDRIVILLALYTTTMDFEWNNQDVLLEQTFSFNLRVFTSTSGERCRNYNTFYVRHLLFKGSKVIGQTNIIINLIVNFNTWLEILCSQWQPEVWNPETSREAGFHPWWCSARPLLNLSSVPDMYGPDCIWKLFVDIYIYLYIFLFLYLILIIRFIW